MGAEAETSPEKTKDADLQKAESEKDKLVAAFERLLSESSVADEDISPKDVDTTRSLDTKDKQEPSIIQEQSGDDEKELDNNKGGFLSKVSEFVKEKFIEKDDKKTEKEEERVSIEVDYFPKVDYPKYGKEFAGIDEEPSLQEDNVQSTEATEVIVDSDSDAEYPKPIDNKDDSETRELAEDSVGHSAGKIVDEDDVNTTEVKDKQEPPSSEKDKSGDDTKDSDENDKGDSSKKSSVSGFMKEVFQTTKEKLVGESKETPESSVTDADDRNNISDKKS